MTQDSLRTPWNRGLIGAWVGSFFVVVGVVVAMRLEGRVWCCDCDSPWTVWKGDVWSSHCSQHVLDPYSFTHFTHGLIFCVVLGWVARLMGKWEHRSRGTDFGGTWTFPVHWRFFVAVLLASGWEVAENSPFVINRYRAATMSLDYLGDSVTNAVADVVCCGVGFWVSRRIGVKMSIGLLLAIEIGLLATTRDNLTLNVLMLVSPVESVKVWQMGGR